jgi:hypothetical protein
MSQKGLVSNFNIETYDAIASMRFSATSINTTKA